MDIAFDTTWCPVCSRQILPKRLLVPTTTSPVTPAPPPSSPTSQPKTSDAPATRQTRSKNGTIRRGGLVHGTGRVKPNGAIKRSEPVKEQSIKKVVSPAPTSEVVQPAAPVRQRTVIDQSPTPLYCSDECRLVDLQDSHGMSISYNPDRYSSPSPPPVPNNSYSDNAPLAESESSSGSLDSESSMTSARSSSSCSITSTSTQPRQATGFQQPVPRGYAALASIYDLPPLPPPPPLLRSDTASSDESFSNDYQSGVIMASRRINEALAPKPAAKRPSWSTPSSMLSTAYALGANSRGVVPGWTDNSHDWRASVYNFSAPQDPTKCKYLRDEEKVSKAYKTHISTPCRSHGVYSTMGDSTPTSTQLSSGPARPRSEAQELYAKVDMAFARRTESRTSLSHHGQLSTSPSGSTRSLPTTSSRRREVSLVKPGAEGRLLVPDVKMRRIPSSSTSCSSSWSSCARVRSPLSRQNSEASVDVTEVSDERPAMSPISTGCKSDGRSWSYSDKFTYSILELPKKEKKIEKRIVDGKEVEVEVEVEVIPERKRLFLFPNAKPARR